MRLQEPRKTWCLLRLLLWWLPEGDPLHPDRETFQVGWHRRSLLPLVHLLIVERTTASQDLECENKQTYVAHVGPSVQGFSKELHRSTGKVTREPILWLLCRSGCIAEDGHLRNPYWPEMSSLLRKLHRLPCRLKLEVPDPKPCSILSRGMLG